MVNRIQRKGARPGFTLMELAIIIAIVGILAAVGAIKFSSMAEEAKAGAAQAALANTRSAFAIAIAKEADGKVTPTELTTYMKGATADGSVMVVDSHRIQLTLAGGFIDSVDGVAAN